MAKITIPELEYDEHRLAKITTHVGNTYTVRKLSDGEFMAAASLGGNAHPELAMIAVVSAALVDPEMTQKKVKEELFDGELMFLFTAIAKKHNEAIDFLTDTEPLNL